MNILETHLHRLSKVNPPRRFVQQSKDRLLSQIELRSNEQWFMAFLRKIGIVTPPLAFLTQARLRLVEKLAHVKPHFGWLLFLRRVAVSTLVMVLAVGSTLFFVDGRQVVTASQDTYLEILHGSATIKRADRLAWDKLGTVTEVSAGDLIHLDDQAQAVLRFFDDTEVRLSPGSLLLISQIYPSPSFGRQGVIEVALHQGHAWVQTQDVEDGYAGFTLVTRDAILQSLNGSFDVSTDLVKPTVVRAFRNNLRVQSLAPATRDVIDQVTLSADQKLTLTASNLAKASKPLLAADKTEQWVQDNLNRDHSHLTVLRDREFNSLQETAGVLPGQVLYPIKLAKERLELAFTFGDDNLTQAQIDFANKRLNEAIVLLRQGDSGKAQEALLAYQNLTQNIFQNAPQTARQEISQRIIAKNQKSLLAALPTDPPIRVVTEALNQTEELIAQDPLQREKIHLANAVDRLNHMADLVTAGDLKGAKEALADHSLTSTDILAQIALLPSTDSKKQMALEVLALQQTEAKLLGNITTLASAQPPLAQDAQFLAMLQEAGQSMNGTIENTLAFMAPLSPSPVAIPFVSAEDSGVKDFVSRLSVYKTWQGQKNEINHLFQEQVGLQWNADFLRSARAEMSDQRLQSLIDSYIVAAQRQQRMQKNKAVKQKIDRAIRMRRD